MVSPCKECMNRAVGCHGQCADYLEYFAWARAKNQREHDCGRSQAFHDEMRKKFNRGDFWK